MDNLFFKPDSARVQVFDQLMRRRLVESLRYLYAELGERVEIDASEFDASMHRLERNPCLPDTFGRYYHSVLAAAQGSYADCEALLKAIISDAPAKDEITFFGFSEPEQDPRSRLYLNFFDSDPDSEFPIRPIDESEFDRAKGLIGAALDLLEKGDAALAAEIRALLKVIMLGTGPNQKGQYTFDGASSFELWGSIALNALRAKDRVAMAEILAHESCHVLLFGFCIDGALVLNPDEERHRSPLRDDPRPLDGIFHATFVLARMFHSLRVMEMSGELSVEEQQDVGQRKKDRSNAFYDGLGVLEKHAKYTNEGKALIEACKVYMDTHT